MEKRYQCKKCGTKFHTRHIECPNCEEESDLLDDIIDIGITVGIAKLAGDLFDGDDDDNSKIGFTPSSSDDFDGFGGGSFGGGGAGGSYDDF
jgi:hypothetical protein